MVSHEDNTIVIGLVEGGKTKESWMKKRKKERKKERRRMTVKRN